MKNVADRLFAACDVLPNELSSRFVEDKIDLFECLVFRLWHKEDLVKPSDYCDSAIETYSQTGSRHGLFHGTEVICHNEAAEEEGCIRCGHAVAYEISQSAIWFQGCCHGRMGRFKSRLRQ